MGGRFVRSLQGTQRVSSSSYLTLRYLDTQLALTSSTSHHWCSHGAPPSLMSLDSCVTCGLQRVWTLPTKLKGVHPGPCQTPLKIHKEDGAQRSVPLVGWPTCTHFAQSMQHFGHNAAMAIVFVLALSAGNMYPDAFVCWRLQSPAQQITCERSAGGPDHMIQHACETWQLPERFCSSITEVHGTMRNSDVAL